MLLRRVATVFYQVFLLVSLAMGVLFGSIPETIAGVREQVQTRTIGFGSVALIATVLSVFLIKRYSIEWMHRLNISLTLLTLLVSAVFSTSPWVSLGCVTAATGCLAYFLCLPDRAKFRVFYVASLVIVAINILFTVCKFFWSHIYSDAFGSLNVQVVLILGVSAAASIALWLILQKMLPKRELLWQSRSNWHTWINILVATLTVGFVVLHVVVIGGTMVARVQGLVTPSFDFGLFRQMFEAMSQGRGMVTTLERGRELSHFAVHVSPIFYVWLPFYMVWPTGECLQIVQILTVVSGVFPAYLIAKKLELKIQYRVWMPLLYLVQAGIFASSFYDVHENAFLAPLLLWLFWSALSGKKWAVCILALLTLAVKEDAAIYLGTLGAWFGLRSFREQEGKRKQFVWMGCILLVSAVVAFVGTTSYLKLRGLGVMDWRYSNLTWQDKGGLASIIVTVVLRPGYVLASLWNGDKIGFFVLVMAALAFLPLYMRRLPNYILLFPFVFIHLATAYKLQYTFGYQYGYGTGALLFIAALLSLAEMDMCSQDQVDLPHKGFSLSLLRQRLIPLALAFALVSGGIHTVVLAQSIQYYRGFATNPQTIEVRRYLETLDGEASVSATTFVTTPLVKRRILYDLEYHTPTLTQRLTDCVVIDRRFPLSVEVKRKIEEYKQLGYEPLNNVPEQLEVLISPEYKQKLSDKK